MAMTTAEKTKLKVARAERDVTPETVTITPAMAQKWLAEDAENPARRNRGVSGNTISAYARDMLHKRWKMSNDAICFDIHGTLLNGQHRLQACCLAGVPFKSLVLRGLSSEAQEAMDQGRPRRMPDILHLRGYKSTVALAGAARKLINLKEPTTMRGARVTSAEVLDVIDRHPKLVESVHFALGGTLRPRGIPTSLVIALHYVGKHLLNEPKKADAFLEVFRTGIPAYAGDPAHKLREKVLSRLRIHTIMTPTSMFYSGVRAWNAFAGGEKMSKFQPPRQAITVYKLDPDLI